MPPPRPSEATLLRTAKVVAATGVAIEIVGRDGLTYRIKPVAGIAEPVNAIPIGGRSCDQAFGVDR